MKFGCWKDNLSFGSVNAYLSHSCCTLTAFFTLLTTLLWTTFRFKQAALKPYSFYLYAITLLLCSKAFEILES